MAEEKDGRLMTVNEVVKLVGVSKRTLQDFVRNLDYCAARDV